MLTAKRTARVSSWVLAALLAVSLPDISLAEETAYAETFSNKKSIGEKLANERFDLLSNTGRPTSPIGTSAEQDDTSRALVKPHLDDAFLLESASGERYTADNYLHADVDDFETGDVSESVAAPKPFNVYSGR